ncbi:hypothetical protein JST56_03730 [Candidatus Dependentiae bacterium]|jgi:hypothetical protein|nr:hypothetical protein [Candidatus Dependentiae bacterium]
MKNLTKVILLGLICCITSNLYGDIVYRLARKADIDQLLRLQAAIAESAEDSAKLVVFPEHVRYTILEEAISRGRLFVATENFDIISFLKLYIIESQKELHELLINELRCYQQDGAAITQSSLQTCISQTDDPTFSPMHNADGSDIEVTPFKIHHRQTFLYYGGAYTMPDKRGQRHGSLLLRNAFGLIRDNVSAHITKNKSTQLILTYGQVLANQRNTLMRREFVKEIPQIHNKLFTPAPRAVVVSQYVYEACMPAFTEEMETLPDSEEREGCGNLIVYNLPIRDLTVSQ